MKRILTTAAMAVLAGSLAFGSAAQAQGWRDHDRDHGGYEHRERGGHDRGGYDRGGYDRGHYDNGRYDRGHYDNGHHYGWRDRSDWRRGGYVARYEWDRGYRIDYRRHHLRHPPYGYEWREVNGNYVLAAVASGLIASIILNQ
ncbi:MAG: RcnB family protein [Asticcacaulis sp.]|nr:RcnB family protein [Asticcacaulis sp.]